MRTGYPQAGATRADLSMPLPSGQMQDLAKVYFSKETGS